MSKLHSRRKNSRRYLNNRGFSMVELIIVIAIMAVITSTIAFSVTLIYGANAKSAANDIQRSIGECKVTTMSRAAAYMELYRDSSDQNVYTRMYIRDSAGGGYVASDPEKVGTNKVYVAYKPEGGMKTELTAGSSIEIRFDRTNGSFAPGTGGVLYEIIYVEGGNKHYEIKLTKLTGKSEVKVP